MTWTILQLAFPMVFTGIALYLYCTKRSLLIGFREQLAVSPKGRRFVALMAMLALLMFHFVALCGTAKPLQLLPSSIIVFMLFSHRYGEELINFLQRRPWNFFAFVLMLATLFQPQTYPFAVTLLVLIITSWIYPTKQLVKEIRERGDTPDIIEETIEELNKEMQETLYPTHSEEEKEEAEESHVDLDPVVEESADENDVEEDAGDDYTPYNQLSEKAIRKQRIREKERERRHNRAKRRARRAKHGR